ncbi:hypothetical protein F4811DRAFT_509838 [Daldinia bambusicola]|nr:hypothetical protein F4811DRAFT_509838 [Daldinia bambusicola]
MYHKTAAAFGLVAVTGVAASTAGTAGGYPAYPVNNTAPSSVWQYYNTTVPTTVVVPQFTTVCPEATTMSYNGVQYTVTKGQTVTVTDCPCTITTAIHTLTSSLCPPGVTPTAVAPAVPTGMTYPGETPAPGTPVAPGNPTYPAPAGTTPAGAAPGAPAQGGSPPAGAAPAVGTSGAAPVANNPSNTPNAPAGTAGYTPSPVPSGIAVSGASSNPGFAAALLGALLGLAAL